VKIAKQKLIRAIRWTEKYAQTDMLYIFRGGFWLSITKIGGLVISFLTMVAFANWLPKEEYGIYQYVISVIGIIAIFTLPGINTALIRSVAKGQEGSLLEAFGVKIKWGIIGSVISLILALWYYINGNVVLTLSFLVGGLFMPLRHAAILFEPFWNGRRQFDIHTKYQLYSASFSVVILIATLYLTNNIVLVVLSFFAAHTVADYFFYRKTAKQIKNTEVDPDIVPFGKSLTLMKAIKNTAEHIDKIVLWHFIGPIQVAIYSFAQMPIKRVQGVLPITALALPKFSERSVKDNKPKLLRSFWKLFLIMAPITIASILAAPIIYGLIFPEYLDSVIYFQALSFLLLAEPFMLFDSALVAEAKTRELYIIKTAGPIIKIALFVGLAPFWGIWGIVSAILIERLIISVMQFYFFKRI
jgi:O-antigen/teichoic acid export membrane protein